jgi:hypothetical protein
MVSSIFLIPYSIGKRKIVIFSEANHLLQAIKSKMSTSQDPKSAFPIKFIPIERGC